MRQLLQSMVSHCFVLTRVHPMDSFQRIFKWC
jgi:hypothetical protein